MPHVLFFSHDPQLISTMQAACTKLAMDMSVCPDVKHAASLLKRKKFYAALVDSAEGNATSDFLAAVRGSPELAMRTLRAAKGSMTKELHRYLRHSMRTAVTLTLASKREVQATSV